MTREKTPQALADDRRRRNQFSVRLDPDTAAQLEHFMTSRSYSANQALRIIVQRFFKGHTNA
tara:strand:- start:712 stop:897 length:186 start_codon:yes stop_codon:yes gene_type:complete